jgi:5-(carboxyamino)imidazole ribonucleotide synthase
LSKHKNTILPPATLGMLGGGQLGRFFVIAAHELGYKVAVLDPDKNSPAGKIADLHLCAAYDDQAALTKLSETCEAITTEFENVPAATLDFLEQSRTVHPSASAVAIAQHRVSEKTFFRDSGLPVGQFVVINKDSDLPADDNAIYPAILKVARFGYDGKGQARVTNQAQAIAAFANFKHETCVLEQMLPLDYEISVVLARDAKGNIAAFPVAENSHLNGILDVSIAPARGSDVIKAKAQALAKQIAEKLDYVGVLGVEFFVSEGKLLVNEMAPRPHNSGHYTIDACVTNQFEQQVRALTGLPLGDASLHSQAVMVNILGDVWKNGEPDWQKAAAHPALKLHLYGKHEARPGRKMGHFTVLGQDRDTVINQALIARGEMGIG